MMKTMSLRGTSGCRTILCASIVAAAAPSMAAPLPGGASSLSEAYQDWQVNCTSKDAAAHCTMVQVQADPKTKQRVLAMEIGKSADGSFSAMLIMPFGIELATGVSLQIDDAAIGSALNFSTCLPAGCLVPVAIDDEKVDALKAGTALTLIAAGSDSSDPISFSISLNGFSGAFARLNELGQ
jgi:invasion protein IalB